MASELPHLRHMLGFLAIAETGTVSQAAQQISLSQPALTQGILRLEQRAGVPLFDRRADGMRLTEPGRLFAQRLHLCRQHLRRGLEACGARSSSLVQISMPQLETLLAVVEAGGFVAAARKQQRNVSTINRACHALEAVMDVSLFEAAGNSLIVNRIGNEFSTAASLALKEIRQVFDDIRNWQGEFSGKLAIGCLPLAQTTLLPDAILRFAREYPLVRIAIVDGYYASLARALLRGELDMIVGALRDNDLPASLVQHEVFSDPLVVVARPRHPLTQQSPLKMQHLANYPWVAPRTGAPARIRFEQLHSTLDIPAEVPVPIETGAPSVMQGLLLASERITLISAGQVKSELQQGVLQQIAVPLPDTRRAIGFTVREDWLPGIPQARFREILVDVLSQ